MTELGDFTDFTDLEDLTDLTDLTEFVYSYRKDRIMKSLSGII